jgi:Flp pilus assembly protein TadG
VEERALAEVRRKGGESGAALIEFAVVLPFLVVVLAVIVSHLQFLSERTTLNEIARCIARTAARLEVPDESSLQAVTSEVAAEYFQALDLDPARYAIATTVVDLPYGNGRSAPFVSVEVSTLAKSASWFVPGIGFDARARSSFRHELAPTSAEAPPPDSQDEDGPG